MKYFTQMTLFALVLPVWIISFLKLSLAVVALWALHCVLAHSQHTAGKYI